MALDAESSWLSNINFDQGAYVEPASICHVVFKKLLFDEVEKLDKSSVALDIGCGSGIGRKKEPQEQIASVVGNLWGVEPDTEVDVPVCFAKTWRSTLENSDIPESSINLAYAFMVLEHVEKPDDFLRRLANSMKPGGVFLAGTINSKCFFATIAALSAKLGIQEQVLRIAKGKKAVEDYHYPAVYQMNTRTSIEKLALAAGFSKVETLVIDSNEWFHYFPKPIRWVGYPIRTIFQFRQDTYPYMFVRMEK